MWMYAILTEILSNSWRSLFLAKLWVIAWNKFVSSTTSLLILNLYFIYSPLKLYPKLKSEIIIHKLRGKQLHVQPDKKLKLSKD